MGYLRGGPILALELARPRFPLSMLSFASSCWLSREDTEPSSEISSSAVLCDSGTEARLSARACGSGRGTTISC
jgi:hypothetical protein